MALNPVSLVAQFDFESTSSVTKTCELLWNCRDANHAREYIDVISQTLTSELPTSYDPSEVFLALQGADLRFRKTDQHEELSIELQEEALMAVALLCRFCIGPAWWKQRQERMKKKKLELLSDDESISEPLDGSSIPQPVNQLLEDASFSARYPAVVISEDDILEQSWTRITHSHQQSLSQELYPPIPEVLPAAIIRFATTIDITPKTLHAQTIIVSSLCHVDEEQQEARNWSIPGIQESVGTMFSEWLEAAVSSDYPWVLRSHLVRGCNDLVSAGWNSNQTVVDGAIPVLLQLSLNIFRGIANREVDLLVDSDQLDMIISCGAEAVATLTCMGSQGRMPLESLHLIAEALVGIHVTTRQVRSDLVGGKSYLLSALETEQYKEILATFDSCIANVENLFCCILGQDSSAVLCVKILMGFVARCNFSSPFCRVLSSADGCGHDEKKEWYHAETALKILSRSFWGDENGFVGLSLLRVYWLPFLEQASQCVTSYIETILASGSDDPVADICVVIVEALRSFVKMIENERRIGVGYNMSNIEWEVTIGFLKSAVVPLIRCANNEVLEGVQAEANTFISRLCKALEHWSNLGTVPFVEYEHQEVLYLTMLGDVVPLLERSRRLTAGLTVIHCWSKFGFSPFRLQRLNETAAILLRAAFRIDSQGNYTHEPSIRLGALRNLTAGKSFTAVHEGVVSHVETMPSFLATIQHTGENYHVFVLRWLIPLLAEVFRSPEIRQAVGERSPPHSVLPRNVPLDRYAEFFQAHFDASSPVTAYTNLAVYAVTLTGNLFRDFANNSSHSVLFIEMLRSLALSSQSLIEDGSTMAGKGTSFRVRLASIFELERCLTACFISASHIHACVPRIIDALTCTFDMYSHDCVSYSADAMSRNVLAISALEPLTRLRVAIDDHIAFRQRERWMCTPLDILHAIHKVDASQLSSATVETFGCPHLELKRTTNQVASMNKTLVGLAGTVEAICHFLERSSLQKVNDDHDLLELNRRCVRTLCFDYLRHYFLALVPRLPRREVARNIFAVSDDIDSSHVHSRSLAAVQYVQCTFICAAQKTLTVGDGGGHDYSALALELIFQMLNSHSVFERKAGSEAFCALLPMLNNQNSDRLEIIYALRCLFVATLRHLRELPGVSVRTDIPFTLLHDFLLLEHNSFPSDICLHAWELFLKHGMATNWRANDFSNLLGMYSAGALLERIDDQQVQCLRLILASVPGDDICKEALVGLVDDAAFRTTVNSISSGRSLNSTKFDEMNAQEKLVRGFQWDSGLHNSRIAWLFDMSILFTCRIGSEKSRYAGCIELILRSHVGRVRRLVQIPGRPHLLDADFVTLSIGSNREGEARAPFVMPQETSSVLKRFANIMGEPESPLVSTHQDDLAEDSLQELSLRGHLEDMPNERALLCQVVTNQLGMNRWLANKLTSEEDICYVQAQITIFLRSCGALGAVDTMPAERIVGLRFEEGLNRAIGVLDRVPVMNTHKIALLYDQFSGRMDDEIVDMKTRLLSTKHCSPAFHKFASGLGRLVPTSSLLGFSGGLDTSAHETDGQFALAWTNAENKKSLVGSTSVIFHLVSLMPGGKQGNIMNRKRHVGNDFVVISFADSGSEVIVQHDLRGGDLIGGAFGLVVIFVTIHVPGTYRVNVRVRNNSPDRNLNEFLASFVNDYSVLEEDGPTFVRNLVIRADLACRAYTNSPDALPNFIYRKQLIRAMTRHKA